MLLKHWPKHQGHSICLGGGRLGQELKDQMSLVGILEEVILRISVGKSLQRCDAVLDVKSSQVFVYSKAQLTSDAE